MSQATKASQEADCEFKWGEKRGIGGKKREVQFYESFTYDGDEYSLYDSVYVQAKDDAEPYIGKLVKIWEQPQRKKKVKILWFFQRDEIHKYRKDSEILENEILLASGDGKGLTNIIDLEAVAGKCNVVCTSKDCHNPQPSPEELTMADYTFYRVFDVGKHAISDKIDDKVAGVDARFLLNREVTQSSGVLQLGAVKKERNGDVKTSNEDLVSELGAEINVVDDKPAKKMIPDSALKLPVERDISLSLAVNKDKSENEVPQASGTTGSTNHGKTKTKPLTVLKHSAVENGSVMTSSEDHLPDLGADTNVLDDKPLKKASPEEPSISPSLAVNKEKSVNKLYQAAGTVGSVNQFKRKTKPLPHPLGPEKDPLKMAEAARLDSIVKLPVDPSISPLAVNKNKTVNEVPVTIGIAKHDKTKTKPLTPTKDSLKALEPERLDSTAKMPVDPSISPSLAVKKDKTVNEMPQASVTVGIAHHDKTKTKLLTDPLKLEKDSLEKIETGMLDSSVKLPEQSSISPSLAVNKEKSGTDVPQTSGTVGSASHDKAKTKPLVDLSMLEKGSLKKVETDLKTPEIMSKRKRKRKKKNGNATSVTQPPPQQQASVTVGIASIRLDKDSLKKVETPMFDSSVKLAESIISPLLAVNKEKSGNDVPQASGTVGSANHDKAETKPLVDLTRLEKGSLKKVETYLKTPQIMSKRKRKRKKKNGDTTSVNCSQPPKPQASVTVGIAPIRLDKDSLKKVETLMLDSSVKLAEESSISPSLAVNKEKSGNDVPQASGTVGSANLDKAETKPLGDLTRLERGSPDLKNPQIMSKRMRRRMKKNGNATSVTQPPPQPHTPNLLSKKNRRRNKKNGNATSVTQPLPPSTPLAVNKETSKNDVPQASGTGGSTNHHKIETEDLAVPKPSGVKKERNGNVKASNEDGISDLGVDTNLVDDKPPKKARVDNSDKLQEELTVSPSLAVNKDKPLSDTQKLEKSSEKKVETDLKVWKVSYHYAQPPRPPHHYAQPPHLPYHYAQPPPPRPYPPVPPYAHTWHPTPMWPHRPDWPPRPFMTPHTGHPPFHYG